MGGYLPSALESQDHLKEEPQLLEVNEFTNLSFSNSSGITLRLKTPVYSLLLCCCVFLSQMCSYFYIS